MFGEIVRFGRFLLQRAGPLRILDCDPFGTHGKPAHEASHDPPEGLINLRRSSRLEHVAFSHGEVDRDAVSNVNLSLPVGTLTFCPAPPAPAKARSWI
jgi:hypothetical protein